MEACNDHNPMDAIPRPESGQPEGQDHPHPLARKDERMMLSCPQMSVRLERWLRSFEIVITRAGNPANVTMENPALTTPGKCSHAPRHAAVVVICPGCGTAFKVRLSHQHRRIYHNDTCRRLAERKFMLDPQELRQLVWEIPTTQIAALYGVSDKAVEKRCRALGIPQPPRGYWTRPHPDKGSLEEVA